jgi:hypothetical protein
LIQSLYVWSLFKSIWCALYDYGSIYVIPVVDIVVWDDICYVFTVVFKLLWFVILWRYLYDACSGFYSKCLIYPCHEVSVGVDEKDA